MSEQDRASLDEALAVPIEKSSLAALNTRLFLQNPGAVGGLAFMLLITFAVILAPWIMPYEPQEIDLQAIRKPPSASHLFGTDLTGRDMLTRILYGGRVSLLIGLLAVLIRTAIGLLLGAISGYFGGAVDFVIQRVVDIMMVFPTIFLLLILVAAFGPTPLTLLIALGLLSWPFDARIFRGQILSIRELDYILAARAIGTKNWGIIRQHIVPNVMPLVLVNMTLGIGETIIAEAGISFLGLGVQPPTPSWGNMVTAANNLTLIQRFWWLWIPPGVVLVSTVVALNLIGDALRDILDPRRRG
ncbi:MAG: ABC transporter permease [Caldilineaceae bacterium]|nr:ABC transporter permease [Caldilineaceae bacterium]